MNGNGGILSTNSNFVSSGALTLSANSVITLGASVHTISFANSSAATWTGGTTLTINGWVGDYVGGRVLQEEYLWDLITRVLQPGSLTR